MKNNKSLRVASSLGAALSGFLLSVSLTGCFGYVRGNGGVVVAEPDFVWFGGYGDGWGARGYGYRGGESRGGFRR